MGCAGHDHDSLLYALLDECLYRFSASELVFRDVRVRVTVGAWSASVVGYGEAFTLDKHTQGTEVKAITYSNMQIFVSGQRVLSDNDQHARPDGDGANDDDAQPSPPPPQGDAPPDADDSTQRDAQISTGAKHGADVYVIIDI